MKVFVKKNMIAEGRMGLHPRMVGKLRPPTVLIGEKDPGQPCRNLVGGVVQREELAGAGGALDLEVIPVVVMKLLQRFDQQKIDRKPDRAAPVGVTSKQTAVRFSRLITH